jgi:hypothetical protein
MPSAFARGILIQILLKKRQSGSAEDRARSGPVARSAIGKFRKITKPKPCAGQSERFSDIGAARRGLGAVCCPAAV